MFYAGFVLTKKGPLSRVWLAAHWDKKLTKAHVFETNINSSVEAILKPKAKLALRTSGHLLLGVVRIYSRKAKYLLADCNEAFVKIKMAFRPGVVDLPEENREAAVAAITLQENFHDFETTLADLEDINVQAQFSVNQSRPEEITMREDLGTISLMGDDGFGDVGFDDRDLLQGGADLDEGLYKTNEEPEKEIERPVSPSIEKEKDMDIDLPPPVVGDGFPSLMDHDGDDDNDDNFGDVDQDFFGEDFMGTGLFEDPTTLPPEPIPQENVETASAEKSDSTEKQTVESSEETSAPAKNTSALGTTNEMSSIGVEQTTLVPNEEEAFALEPLDITSVPGTERKGKRRRKLIVDEQKGIPSETMKLQLSDTSDIVTSLDLAPPTKKLMLWKETGGVEKLFALSGKTMISKDLSKSYSRHLVCKAVSDDYDPSHSKIDLEITPDVARENERNTTLVDVTRMSEMSTIMEEPSRVSEISQKRSSRAQERENLLQEDLRQQEQEQKEPEQVPVADVSHRSEPLAPDTSTLNNQSLFDQIPDNLTLQPQDVPTDPTNIVPTINPLLDDGPPSVAPFSVPPPSVPPNLTFNDMDVEQDLEQMPENAEQEEKRWSKRTQQMQEMFERAFCFSEDLSFKEMSHDANRKQAASWFYTMLVLKKNRAICAEQTESFGDIIITKGPNFGNAC